jgi:Tfp pilus assembly protein PilV
MAGPRGFLCLYYLIKGQSMKRGISIIEVMIASIILLIGLFGVFTYRYTSILNAVKANSYITGSRIAWLLVENWRGNKGSSYDPTASGQLSSIGLTISTNTTGPSVPAGFTKLGQYKVVENNVNYFVTMSWKNFPAVSGVNELDVIVAWSRRKQGTSTVYADADDTFHLTTYAQY